MHYPTIRYALWILSLFFAFLAIGINFFYSRITKGGAAENAAKLNAIAIISLSSGMLLSYFLAETLILNIMAERLYIVSEVLTLSGFALICYAQYLLLRAVK